MTIQHRRNGNLKNLMSGDLNDLGPPGDEPAEAIREALHPPASCIVYTNGNFALCFPMPDSNSPMARWRSDDAKALNGLVALV